MSRPPAPLSLVGVLPMIGSAASLAACLPSANIETSQTPRPTQADSGAARGKAASKPKRRAARGRGPVVIEAELRSDGAHLHLELSEPLAPTEGVDPNDFRLSLAMAYSYRTYAYAYYYDPGEATSDAMMQVVALRGSADALELYLDPPFDLSYCVEIEREVQDMRSEPGVRANGGLFLHYAPGERPITDTEGHAMSAFAAEWVLRKRRGDDEAYEMYFEGPAARRALRDAIPVRCGPELPPGPR